MWGWILASAAGFLAGKSYTEKQKTPALPDAWQAVCPVDPHMPDAFQKATRNAWATGSVDELRTLAGNVRAEYPIAAASLYAKAETMGRVASGALDMAKAVQVTQGNGKVVEMRREDTSGGKTEPAKPATP